MHFFYILFAIIYGVCDVTIASHLRAFIPGKQLKHIDEHNAFSTQKHRYQRLDLKNAYQCWSARILVPRKKITYKGFITKCVLNKCVKF